MSDAQSIAEKVVRDSHPDRQRDFVYSGDTPLGETHGIAISRTRDSDLLEESNYEVILKDLGERFPTDVHCKRGWVDTCVASDRRLHFT